MYNNPYEAQQALKSHLNAGKTAGAFTCKTISEYAGELTDAHKTADIIPAVLIPFIQGASGGNDARDHRFYLIVITKSDSFDPLTHHNNNLQLLSDIGIYLDDNPTLEYTYTEDEEEITVQYIIDRERLDSRLFFQDNKYTVAIIELYMKILI
jgi:hypothetical protein